MKNVLIVARYTGTRLPGLLKYLPEFGWQPVLLTTVLPPGVKIPPGISVFETGGRIETGFTAASGGSFFQRFLSLGGEIFNYPDSYKSWRKPGIVAGDKILRDKEISVILSSSSPVSGHTIARELKTRYKILRT